MRIWYSMRLTQQVPSAPRHVRPHRHQRPRPPNDRPLIACLGLGLVAAFGAGTQYVAWRLGFHPSLGLPLLIPSAETVRLLHIIATVAGGVAILSLLVPRGRLAAVPAAIVSAGAALSSLGPLYAPYRIIVWQATYAEVDWIAPVLRTGWLMLGATAITMMYLVLRLWSWHGARPPSASHGSAHWGSGQEFHRTTGLLVGRNGPHLLRYAGDGHLLTVAPTRSGKGVSAVIPNLLEYPGSVLVTDPKAENYAVTARRRRELGQRVHAFDPFGVVGGKAAYNPLGLVNSESPDAIDDARMLADMLVLSNEREGQEAYWNEEARGLLTGLILHVAAHAPRERRTLIHVRELLTLPPQGFANLLADMANRKTMNGLVARSAARILQKADRERSGVISTAQSHTHFLDSPRMEAALGGTTVDLAALKRERISMYLILPTERLDGYARWLRLMIACALLAVARERGRSPERVLFLLDEFAALRRMQPVQRDIGLAGGYGACFWLLLQDLAQLRGIYGDTWATFLANAEVIQAYGTNDLDTAEYLSRLTGDATVAVESENRSAGVSRGKHANWQRGTAVTISEQGRRLLTPDEVRRLPRDLELLFPRGRAPLLVRRLDYLHDPEFKGQADANPLYNPIGATVT